MRHDDEIAARELVESWVRREEDNPQPDEPADWPEAAWLYLVRTHPDLRVFAAHCRSCPEAAVRVLATDEEWRVRNRVAMKRNLPKDLFEVFARDEHDGVRQSVASNAKAPLSIVEALSRDPAEHVARVAIYNLQERRRKAAK